MSSEKSLYIPLKKRKGLSEKQLAQRRGNASKAGRASALAKIPITYEKKLKRAKIEKLSEQKLLRGVQEALNVQLIAMKGTHRVVVVTKDEEGKNHIETVRDIKRIDALLESGEYGKDYLILAGAEPDWRAADAFLSRALGKPVESIKHSGTVEHKFSLVDLARERRSLPAHTPLQAPIEVEAKVIDTPRIGSPSEKAG